MTSMTDVSWVVATTYLLSRKMRSMMPVVDWPAVMAMLSTFPP
jgi:hypothetical protein